MTFSMKINVLKHSRNEIKIEIIGESHSFCNALQRMLLKEEGVDLAGYSINHPLISEPTFYIRTKRGVEAKAKLIKAAKSLEKRMNTFQKAFKKAWKEGSEK